MCGVPGWIEGARVPPRLPIEVVIGTKGAAPCDGAFSGGRDIGVRT